jgi:MFS family permease
MTVSFGSFMAQRSEVIAVYVAGVIQGLALVTFPAASNVFTSAANYGFSSTEYGGMFVPQAIMAVVSSFLGAGLTRRLGGKRILLVGLMANLLAMLLLLASQRVMHQHMIAYGVLLVATTCMGVGFGFTVPALNTFAAAFFPQKIDGAVLGLNALLGLGTALAPVFVAIFIGLGMWWGLPLLVSLLLVGLLLFSAALPLREGAQADPAQGQQPRAKIAARFWVFGMFVLLYGICETMNGNWATLYMTQQLGATVGAASAALAVFWGTVAGGRLLFAVVERWIPERVTYQILPVAVAVALIAAALIPGNSSSLGVLIFGLAGLGCSALLPLTISSAQRELTSISASVAGGLITLYQIGYGIAAFGVGPIRGMGVSLKIIFGCTAILALLMGGLAFVVNRGPILSDRKPLAR